MANFDGSPMTSPPGEPKEGRAERLANAVAFYLTVTDCRDKPFDSRAVHEASEHMKKALVEYEEATKVGAVEENRWPLSPGENPMGGVH